MTVLQRLAVILALLGVSTASSHSRADPASSKTPAPPAVATPGTGMADAMWDLTSLYPSVAAWDGERTSIATALPSLAALKGSLTDAASLQAALDRISAIHRRLTRLEVYAQLAADADTRVSANQERRQRAEDLDTDFSKATAFLNPEVGALGRDKVEGFIASTPGLAKHRYQLETILRLAQHTLGNEAESVLAAAQTPLQQPEAIYSLLSNADLPWPVIGIRGEKVTLDQEGYVAHRDDRDPEVRKRVFETFWKAFAVYQRTFGATLSAEVLDTAFIAKARKYPSSLSMAVSGDNIPDEVYRTMIAEAEAGLPTLHRYLKDAKTLLGLKQLHYYDTYVPLAAPPRKYTLADAEALTLEAVKPLGETYAQDLTHGFESPWMNAVVQRGKKSGAYMEGAAYDVHPFVLLSFSGNYESVSTVAHEWGHAMHTVLANRAQPFETADYPIFIAEIPSTTNEMLLVDHVIAASKTKAEKIFALSQALELLRGTFFRQAMFADFEAHIHDAVDRGDPLTGEGLTKTYLDLLRRYMGDAEGIMKVDDLYGVEWAYIPHFYTDFYVYQYATCVSAAAYFADGIEKGDTDLRNRYFTMLKAGGSDDPYKIVKAAGLDMATPAPYRAIIARMNHLLDELEETMRS